MHKKQTFSYIPTLQILIFGFALLVVAGVVTLAVVDVPAPQTPVEKALDAKTFLGAKN